MPISNRPCGRGSSSPASFWVTRRIWLSARITSSRARMDFSRPTKSGTTMCGKTTMSRSGRTGGVCPSRARLRRAGLRSPDCRPTLSCKSSFQLGSGSPYRMHESSHPGPRSCRSRGVPPTESVEWGRGHRGTARRASSWGSGALGSGLQRLPQSGRRGLASRRKPPRGGCRRPPRGRCSHLPRHGRRPLRFMHANGRSSRPPSERRGRLCRLRRMCAEGSLRAVGVDVRAGAPCRSPPPRRSPPRARRRAPGARTWCRGGSPRGWSEGHARRSCARWRGARSP